MRFPGGLWQLLAAGKRGAQMDPADAELFVPAVVQPSVEIPFPLQTNTTAVGAQKDTTFSRNLIGTRAGVQIALRGLSQMQFAPGLWRIKGSASMGFTGTTNVTNFMYAGLTDPNGADIPFLLMAMVTGTFVSCPIDHWLHVIDPNWDLVVVMPAQVALDVAWCSLQVICSRMGL